MFVDADASVCGGQPTGDGVIIRVADGNGGTDDTSDMFGVDADADRVNDAIFVIGDGIDDGDDECERDNGGNGCDVGADRK